MENNEHDVEPEVPAPTVEELEEEWAVMSCDTEEG